MSAPHIPVLCREFLDFYAEKAIKIFVDGTLGAGGHAAALLEQHPEIKLYVGIDQDPEARRLAEERLAPWSGKVKIIAANFAEIPEQLQQLGITQVDGIWLDLGVSSMQLDQAERGFSFSKQGPLDMRMNRDQPLSAASLVNEASEQELGRIFRDYGEEPRWRAAARAIVEARREGAILTTARLVEVLRPLFAHSFKKKSINPMTLIFQGLRIAVNEELTVLERLIPAAVGLLAPGAILGIISYHSLEDRIVKNLFRFYASDKYDTSGIAGMFLDKVPEVNLLTRKPIEAGDEELLANPRARSAKLRFVEKR